MTYVFAQTDFQIYQAALNNKWDDVRGLFIQKPELMTKTVNDRLETPLMIAVGTNSSHEFVKKMLNNVTRDDHDNHKWRGVNKRGDNVLHYAAQVGNMEDARLMAGCFPLWMMSWVRNSRGDTPVLLATQLGRKDMIDEVFLTHVSAQTDVQISQAALQDDWNDVSGLFVQRPDLMTKTVNDRLETPLMIAVATNSSHDFVKQLLNNVTPLYHDSIKWCGVNNSGDNVLHYAAQVGNMEDARLMTMCLPFEIMSSVKNSSGYTPMLLAAKQGRKDMIDEFFLTDVDAETDLQIYKAALNNNWDDVHRLFIRRPELMTKTVNKRLETPLMIAVGTNSSHEFVKKILNNVTRYDHDNHKWRGVNKSGDNVLHYAAQVGNMEDARLMAGCFPLWMMIWVRNSSGDTPVLLAAKRGMKDMVVKVFLTYVFEETDLQIYKAALNNKWANVSELFIRNPLLMTKPVNERLETPLMIAVGTNSSHEFVKQLLFNVTSHDHDSGNWCGVNKSGNNVFHHAVKVGNMEDARHMARCLLLEMMLSAKNSSGYTPLLLAAKLGRKDMIDKVFLKETTISNIETNLAITAIQTGLLDLALLILHYSQPDGIPPNALEALATKPEFFPSGNRLGFWGGLIYQWMPIIGIEILERATGDAFFKLARRLEKLRSAFTWAPTLKNIQDIKTNNEMGNAIMKYLCKIAIEIAIEKKDPVVASKVLGSAIAKAVKYGIYELIEECMVAYPGIIWYEFEGYNLFHLAIKERQVQVYNLVYQMSGHKAFAASELHAKEKENALHIAAKLAPPHRLSTITGAALQLQSELQWYKEVETFVEPEHVTALNKDGKTPWMVFTDEHKDLLIEGQQWMKETATSSTVVAALIVTIAFAAAITVPGGNKDDGKPVFLDERLFILFMISNAFALFSSSTSLLMFLGILTSRYAEMDFLHALPKRLIIGLVSLFLSIVTTMIAFGATIALLLHDKVTWIAAPVVLLTSIPVGLYALLQFPLLVEIVWSTYGPSIFRKQSSRIIY